MKNRLFILSMLLLLTSASISHSADRAMDFTLTDINGNDFNLYTQLKEGPVLIDFWATWCKPCLQALPAVENLHKKYSEKGLQAVAISIDNPRGKSRVRPFILGQGFTFKVLYDTNIEVRPLFGGRDIPYAVLINQKGEIAYRHLGYSSGDEKKLEEYIIKVLSEAKEEE